MHQPSAGVGGTATDIAIQAEVFGKMKRLVAELTAAQTGQDRGSDHGGFGSGSLVYGSRGAGVRLCRPHRGECVMTGRYVLPSFVERTSYGLKESTPYNKLFEDRIVFLGVPVDDTSASDVMAQLLWLEGTIRIGTSGLYQLAWWPSTSLMAIYDTMQFVRPDIETVCLGRAASAAAVLLAAGTPGKRYALPNSRVLIHQPSLGGVQGQVSDLEIHSAEIQRVRRQVEVTLARHTGKEVSEVRRDIERDLVLTADEACPMASLTTFCRIASCAVRLGQ